MTAFLTDPHLVLAWGTVRPASFPDRVAAAAEAGFPSIGLALPYYAALRADGWTDDELHRVLDDFGVTIDEVEVLFGFHAPPGPANLRARPGLVYADPAAERTAFRLADEFGVRHVQAVGTLGDETAGPEAVDAFASLCDRAAPHGLAVALEFVPYSSIPDLASAAALVAAADRPNGGLCVDTWHFFRGRPDLDLLASVPGGQVLMVQVNDGPEQPDSQDRMVDAVHGRRCPGEGDFDLDGFLGALDRPDIAASVSVEVYSDALWRLTSTEAARRAVTTTRSALAADRRHD